MSRCSPWTLAPMLALGWLLSAAPAPLPAQVRDEAHFFSSQAIRQADEIIRSIRTEHKEDLLIETFATAPEEVSKAERNRYFERWAKRRAEEARLTGVYVLICKQPPHIQAEVGNRTQQRAFTVSDRDELVQLLVARFKEKEFDDGLLEAVRFVQRRMDEHLGHAAARAPAGGRGHGLFANPWGWVCMGLGVVVVLWVVIGLARMASGAARPAAPYYDGPPSARPGYGPSAPGGPGYGPGYGPPPASGGGFGGFLSGLAGGMLGAAAGSWMYDRFFRGGDAGTAAPAAGSEAAPGVGAGGDRDTSYTGSGGDFGTDSGGGGGGGAGGDFGDDSGSAPEPEESGDDDYGAGGDFDDTGSTGDSDFGGGDSGGDTGAGGDF